jgi:uncharacterized protein (UPF0332 family)
LPDPAELLKVARLLASGPPDVSDARLRRAASTAYYAVFHKILRLAADRFVGETQRHTAAYRLLYRGFDHGRVNEVCEAIDKPMMNKVFRDSLGRAAVSAEMRDFAAAFRILRDARHGADYDPAHRLTTIVVNRIIQMAETAMADLDAVAADELADVLALMMVRTRH